MLSLALLTGGRAHVLGLLVEDKTWQRTRLKSAQGAASVLVDISKRVLIAEARAMISVEIGAWWETFLKANGPAPPDKSDDWYEAHDDGLLALFEQFANVLSASWLNFVTTDARLWLPNEDSLLAEKFAQEVWKQLTWKRSDNQILAGVGIVADDLNVYGGEIAEEPTTQQVEYTTMEVNAVLNRIMLSFPDPKGLADNLDLVSDNDDILAQGAAQRLGLLPEDVKVLQEIRAHSPNALRAWHTAILLGEELDVGRDYVDLDPHAANALPAQVGNGQTGFDAGPELPKELVRSAPGAPPPPPVGSLKDKLQASQGTPPPPPPPSAPAVTGTGPEPGTNTGKGGRRKKNAAEPPAGYIPVETLRQVKDATGLKDELLAEMLGISRPTLANIMKGKGWCVPNNERRNAILNTLATHAKALNEAYKVIGG